MTRWIAISLCLVWIPLVGCADAGTHMSDADSSSPRTDDDSDSSNGSSGANGGSPSGSLSMEANTDTAMETPLGSTVSVGVILREGSEPAHNEQVTFSIVDDTGDDNVQLEASGAFTDEHGRVSNRVRAGDTAGQITVRADHDDTEPVDFQIDVTEIPAGDLQVSTTYDQASLLAIHDLEVRYWHSSTINCTFVSPYNPPSQPAIDEDLLPTPDDTATFQSLLEEDSFTVTVTGHGPEGQIAAHGCADDVTVDADQLTELTIDVELLDLTPQGTYEIRSTWDFSEALAQSGPLGQTITDAFDWVINPGEAAADYLVGLIVDWVCDSYGTVSTECGLATAAELQGSAQGLVADFINDQIDNIGILSDFQDMALDLISIVTEMEVESILTIEGKTGGQGQVRGLDAWRAIYFYWTQGCDAGDPDDCGEIRLGLGDNTEFGFFQSTWDGEVYDYDQLYIEPHDMVLPYGQFITHILRQHLIPAITGGDANSLSGAFEVLLCDNIGGFSAWGVSIDSDTIQGFCNSAFSAVGTLGELYIHNLEYDIDLSISGEAHLLDLSSDGDVDTMEQGLFFGVLEGEDGQTTDMEASFSGERID